MSFSVSPSNLVIPIAQALNISIFDSPSFDVGAWRYTGFRVHKQLFSDTIFFIILTINLHLSLASPWLISSTIAVYDGTL
jgi:ABC-type sugar transport system permease subunit